MTAPHSLAIHLLDQRLPDLVGSEPAMTDNPTPNDIALLREAVKRELERQCGIGAGTFTIDEGYPEATGLWQINADLDPNALFRALVPGCHEADCGLLYDDGPEECTCTPIQHDDATAEGEASAGAIAAFNDAFDAYAQHIGDPDGRDDIQAATNAAALVIDAFAKPAPSEQARAEGDRDPYEVANQLAGYVGPDTPKELAAFLMRESAEAARLADRLAATFTSSDDAEGRV